MTEKDNKVNTDRPRKRFKNKRYSNKNTRPNREIASVNKLATQEDLLKLKDFFDQNRN